MKNFLIVITINVEKLLLQIYLLAHVSVVVTLVTAPSTKYLAASFRWPLSKRYSIIIVTYPSPQPPPVKPVADPVSVYVNNVYTYFAANDINITSSILRADSI